MVQSRSKPLASRDELRALDSELQSLRSGLPDELKLSSRQLTFMAHSQESSKYIMLHTKWHMCHADLHAFLIPGLRESVSKDVYSDTPSEYAEYCQRQCLDSSIKMCDLWSLVYHLDTRRAIGDSAFCMIIYQTASRIDSLSHLLPQGKQSVDSLRTKLTEALHMALPLRGMYPWVQTCVWVLQLPRTRLCSYNFLG